MSFSFLKCHAGIKLTMNDTVTAIYGLCRHCLDYAGTAVDYVGRHMNGQWRHCNGLYAGTAMDSSGAQCRTQQLQCNTATYA